MIFTRNRAKVQMSTMFLRVRPWDFVSVFICALAEPFTNVFFFFPAEHVGSVKTQKSPKNTKPHKSKEKNNEQKNTFVKGTAGAHLTRVQNFRV